MRTKVVVVALTAAFLLGCEKSAPPPLVEQPGVQIQGAAGPSPVAAPAPAAVPPDPAAVPAGLIAAGQKVGSGHDELLKEVPDMDGPEVSGARLPVVVFYYSSKSYEDKAYMALIERLAKKFEGRVRFLRSNIETARLVGKLPRGTISESHLYFIKGKERIDKSGAPGPNAERELTFFIEEWLAER